MNRIRKFLKNFVTFMQLYRPFLRGNYMEYLIVFLVFTVLILLYTGSVALNMTTQLFASQGDATAGFLWLNFADPGINPFLSPTDYVNYPYGESLGGPTFIAYTALWLPLRFMSFLFGPVAGLNIVMYWGFVSAALASYWLLKRLTGSVSVSLFAGFATAFVPYAMYKSSGHLAYIFSYVFVLIVAGFIGVWSRPTKLRALLLAGSIALAFYTDGYFVLLASVLVAGLCLSGILFALISRMRWHEVWRRIRMLVLSAVFLVGMLLPIAFVQISQGDKVGEMLSSARSSIRQEIKEYRANVVDFILPAGSNPFFQNSSDFHAMHASKNNRSNAGESTNYIGFILIFFSVVGAILALVWVFFRRHSSLKRIDKHTRDKFLLTTCIAVCVVPLMISFMFSPEVYVLGVRIPLPGALLVHFDISLWRVMSRFFVPLHAVIAIFAAFSLWIVLKIIIRKRLTSRWGSVVSVGVVAIFGILLAGEYATTVHSDPFDFTKVAKGYHWLKEQKNIDVIVELPVVDPLDHRITEYITAQVVHGKKMVNMKEPSNMRLTDTLGFSTNEETIDWAYQRGANAAVTHGDRCNAVPWGQLVFRDDKDVKKAMCVYMITSPPSMDELFVLYGEGFTHSPNQPDPSVTVFNKGRATLYITKDNFKKDSLEGHAVFEGILTAGSGNVLQTQWIVRQQGATVYKGEIKSGETPFAIEVDTSLPVEIEIKPTDGHTVGLGEFTIMKAEARRL